MEASKKRELKAPGKAAVLDMLDKQAPAIAMALPKFMDPDHFRRVVTTEIRRTPALMQCDPITVVASCMLAAQMGMEPGPLGQCYLIPRNNRKTGRKECVFQLGYKGQLALAHRSGEVADMTVETVHAHDEFVRRLGDGAEILHVPAPWGQDRGEAIGYYAVVRTKNGGTYRAAMSKQEVEEHAKRFSESFGRSSSPWNEHFDAQAKKTVLRQALKLAPMSIDFQHQASTDGTVVRDLGVDMVQAAADGATEVEADAVRDSDEEPAGEPEKDGTE